MKHHRQHNHEHRQSPIRYKWIFISLCAIYIFTANTAWAEADTERLQDTRTHIEKWVETRRVISQEKHDFEVGKEMLNERIELVQGEIDETLGKIRDAEISINKADLKRSDLIVENDKLKRATSELDEVIKNLEVRTLGLLKQLPDPICDRVKPLSQRIPNPEEEEIRMTLSERFQNVVGILNEINKFNLEITVTSEVRNLSDGTSSEVTAMYVGIAQGYYVNANATIAGVGSSTPDGWLWQPANHAAPQIKDVIDILKNEKVAGFVQLPLEVK